METRTVSDARAADPERADACCASLRSRSSSGCCSTSAPGRAGRRGSSSGSPRFTDQLDGYLARRWRVESQFGKVADPLADRLMIDTAVVMLVALDRLPWVALVILAPRSPARRRLQARRPARLRVRGLAPREDRDLGAVRVDRARARDRAGNVVARRVFLDQPRARGDRGRPVRAEGATRGARAEQPSAPDSSGRCRERRAAGRNRLLGTKPQAEVDPFATLQSSHDRALPTGKAPVETLPDLLPLSDDELSALLAQIEDG